MNPSREALEKMTYCNGPIRVQIKWNRREAEIDPELIRFQHGASVRWEFHDVPPGLRPKIRPVSFQPVIERDGNGALKDVGPVSFRLFKKMELEGDVLTGEPYRNAGGVCWYEVVLVTEGGTEHRLDCSKAYMGGIIIDPPPPD